MRRKRAHQKKRQRRNAVYHVISLLSLATTGIAHTTASTHALYIDQTLIEAGTVSAAFVFPKTVNDIARRAGNARSEAARHHDQVKELLLVHKLMQMLQKRRRQQNCYQLKE
ncbi:hypothetical protein [Effusibacillus consociatus]|uniref:Uncharacterized protein n=1 Tax=Effusibacillus consociatus TaxID=1117041 RepID=A0ABV9PYI0_9BACL